MRKCILKREKNLTLGLTPVAFYPLPILSQIAPNHGQNFIDTG